MLAESEKLSTSEKSCISENSSDYYKYNSPEKKTSARGLKLLTPKQMLQILPIALAQAKAGNTSENLLHAIRQIIYFLYQAKKITKNVYNNIMKSRKM